MRDETLVLENDVRAFMSTSSYINQDRISFIDGNTTAAQPVSPQSEDACGATREHQGHKKKPETNKSEDSSGSFQDNVQCLDAVAAEPLQIQEAAQQPCNHSEGPRFAWTLTPLHKTKSRTAHAKN